MVTKAELIAEARGQQQSGIKYAPEGNILGRVGAGLVNTVKDAVPGLYALPDAAHDLYDIFINKQAPTPGREHLPGARAAMDWITSTDEGVRDFFGLERADPIMEGNVTDALLENVPGVFLPFGAAANAAKAAKLPMAARAGIHALSTIAGTPTTKTGKLLAGTAIGGIDAGLIHLMDNKGLLNEPRTADGTGLRDQIIAEARHTALPAPQAVRTSLRNSILSEALANREITNEEGVDWKDAALAATAVLAGAAAVKTIRSNIARKALEGSAKFGLNTPEKSGSGTLSRLRQGYIDKDAAITNALRGAGEDAAADFVDMSRPGGSLEARMRAVAGTGEIAGSTVKLPKLADEMSRLRTLSDDQRNMLYEGIRAGDKLTEHASDPAGISLGAESYADLRAKVRAIERDTGPVGQFARNYRDLARGMAKYRYENGLIDGETYQKWSQFGHWYMPRFARDEKGYYHRVLDAVTTGNGFLPNSKDAKLKAGPVPDDVKLVDPYKAMQQYMYDTIRKVDENEIRKYTSDALLKNNPDMIRLAEKGDRGTFKVFRDGKATSYYVKDPILRDALAFRPQESNVLLGAMRYFNEWYTRGTTGVLNPAQSIRSFLYDTFTAVATSPRDMRYTPSIGGIDIGLVPGIGQTVAIGQGAVGAMALLRANLARSFSGIFRDIAYKGGPLAPFAEVLGQRLGDAFSNSTLNVMERYGAISGRFLHADNLVPDLSSVMRELAPATTSNVPNAVRLYNVYHGILDSLQNGARAYYFMKHSKQLPKGVDAYQHMLKVAKNTRQLTGDFGKSGASGWNTWLRAGVPYWNPSLQSFAALGKAAKKDPLHFGTWAASTMVTMGGAAYLMMSASPEHADWYRNQLSMSDRNRFMWIPKWTVGADGVELAPPEQSWGIPLAPEMQSLNAMASSFMETFDDARNSGDPVGQALWEAAGETWGSPKFQEQGTEALMQALPFSVPQLGVQAASLGGMKVPLGRFTAEQVYTSPYDDGAITPMWQNVFSAFLGTAGASWAKAIDEASLDMKGPLDIDDADLSAGLQSILEDAGHYSPTIAPMWGHNRKMTGGTFNAKVFSDQNAAIKRIQGTTQYLKDYLSGTMGSGVGQGALLSGKTPLTQMDPNIIRAYFYIDETMRGLQPFMEKINSLQKEISAQQNNPRLSPKQKAEETTQRLRQLEGLRRYMTKAYGVLMEDTIARVSGRRMTLQELADYSQMSNEQ